MNHEKMVSKVNCGCHGSSLPIRRGNDWSCSGFPATAATDSGGRGQALYRRIRWIAIKI